LDDYVAEVDADPELDPLLWRGARVARGHAALDLGGTSDAIDHARELGEKAVPGVLYCPAAVHGDLRIDQFPEVRGEPFVRPLLTHPHQARIPRHIGGEDRGEAADRGHFVPERG